MITKDKEVWENYTQKIKRLNKEVASFLPIPSVKAERQKQVKEVPSKAKEPRIQPLQEALGSLERKREQLLKQGSLQIEGRLDLHGLTQKEAHQALADFIGKKAKAGKRNLLVITGKGRGGGGVLRSHLPLWLEQLSYPILALRPAAPKHGGDGAFYIILRKQGR